MAWLMGSLQANAGECNVSRLPFRKRAMFRLRRQATSNKKTNVMFAGAKWRSAEMPRSDNSTAGE